MTIENNKLITSNLTNTTIKLEQRKNLKNARNQKKNHLNPIVAFIELH
jgi:hypothetical protein